MEGSPAFHGILVARIVSCGNSRLSVLVDAVSSARRQLAEGDAATVRCAPLRSAILERFS